MSIENDVDHLRDQVARLEQLVEGLLARPVEGAGAATRIATVKLNGSSSRLQDYDGSGYVDAPVPTGGSLSDVEIDVEPIGGDLAIWRPVANRWEQIPVFSVIRFSLPEAITSSTIAVPNCPVVAVASGKNPGATATIYNQDGFEGDAGAEGWAFYDGSSGHWTIFVLPCPAGSS